MKTIKKLLTIFFAIALISSCSKVIEPEVSVYKLPDVIFASLPEEGGEPQTRTYAEGHDVLWHNGDAFSYFAGYDGNAKYVYEGESGVGSAEFRKTENAKYQYDYDNMTDYPLAVYPYEIVEKANYYKPTQTYYIYTEYPSVQTYAPDSFGRGANLMIATGSDNQDNHLYFRNACGYLVLKLYSDYTKVRSITLSSIDDKVKISGYATITVNQGDENFKVSLGDYTSQSEVTLDCSNGGDGVVLGTDEGTATEFWFALPPRTIEGGFRIVVTDTDGFTYTKETTKNVVIKRNEIQPMAALELSVMSQDITTVPAADQIWYTRDEGETSPVTFGSADPFDAEIESHRYYEDRGIFVIDFKSAVRTIKSKAFQDVPITGITLPDGLETIGVEAFAGEEDDTRLMKLSSITIPGTVNLIDANAFRYCWSLKSVKFEPSPTATPLNIECATDFVLYTNTWSPFYFTGVVRLDLNREFNYIYEGNRFEPDTMDEALFCSTQEVSFGEQFKTITDWMFAETGLTEITIPGHITHIGSMAFYSSEKLTKVTISSGVTSIGDGAFSGCYNLTDITIPETVTALSDNLFTNCSGLTGFTIPSGITTIGNGAFQYCKSLTSITIPGSVNSIGNYAFDKCTSLESVTFEGSSVPLSVGYNPGTLDDDGLFYDSPLKYIYLDREMKSTNVSELTWDEGVFASSFIDTPEHTVEVHLGQNVKTILGYMFSGVRMKTITIPSSVTEIQYRAFYDCNILSHVICEPATPPSLSPESFGGCDAFQRISVPAGSFDAYRSAENWSRYALQIFPIN